MLTKVECPRIRPRIRPYKSGVLTKVECPRIPVPYPRVVIAALKRTAEKGKQQTVAHGAEGPADSEINVVGRSPVNGPVNSADHDGTSHYD
jgi:hypothetical protein